MEPKKYPSLTSEEVVALIAHDEDHINTYGAFRMKQYVRIASTLTWLAVRKSEGIDGYDIDIDAAKEHFLKAEKFNPEVLYAFPVIRSSLGLNPPIERDNSQQLQETSWKVSSIKNEDAIRNFLYDSVRKYGDPESIKDLGSNQEFKEIVDRFIKN